MVWKRRKLVLKGDLSGDSESDTERVLFQPNNHVGKFIEVNSKDRSSASQTTDRQIDSWTDIFWEVFYTTSRWFKYTHITALVNLVLEI